MQQKKATYRIHSRILTSFLSIPQTKYLQKIHYFEKKEAQIQNLPTNEQYILFTHYADALYHLSVFNKYLPFNHQVITMSLNPQLEEDESIYKQLLYRKATALYKVGIYQESIYVCKELIKMDYEQNFITRLFVRSQKRVERDKDHRFKAILIILISTLTIVYFVQSIFISAFYPEFVKLINIILAGITVTIGVQIIWHEYMVNLRAKSVLKKFMTELQRSQENTDYSFLHDQE